MSKPRRKYTREFKLAAVKLITEQGRSVAEAARSLGVSEKQLRHWKAVLAEQGQQAFPGNGNLPPPTRNSADSKRRTSVSVWSGTS